MKNKITILGIIVAILIIVSSCLQPMCPTYSSTYKNNDYSIENIRLTKR